MLSVSLFPLLELFDISNILINLFSRGIDFVQSPLNLLIIHLLIVLIQKSKANFGKVGGRQGKVGSRRRLVGSRQNKKVSRGKYGVGGGK